MNLCNSDIKKFFPSSFERLLSRKFPFLQGYERLINQKAGNLDIKTYILCPNSCTMSKSHVTNHHQISEASVEILGLCVSDQIRLLIHSCVKDLDLKEYSHLTYA